MTSYSALCVSVFFNEQLITEGTVFIGWGSHPRSIQGGPAKVRPTYIFDGKL